MHYLDNYFMVVPAHSSVCAHNVKTILHMASQVGIPLAPNKLEGPTTRLVFLGTLIDTSSLETSLPDDKLHKLISEFQSWSTRNKCLKRELLSLMGKLNFACRIIPAGRIFLHPDDKLHKLTSEFQSWSTRNKCLKRELLSLMGKLNFACWIIPAPHFSAPPYRPLLFSTPSTSACHHEL